jgi:uncharacterized protein YjeT (DUF2065 family)
MWSDLFAALALVLVIEGILPFVNPTRWRRMVQMLAQFDDRTLRTVGLASMALGLVLLFLVRHSA